MQKRLFNYQQILSRSRHFGCILGHATQAEYNDKLSLQAFEWFSSKHTTFLNHIIQPLNISSKFYPQLQFIYGLPILLSKERFFFRESRTIVNLHDVNKTIEKSNYKFLSYLQVSQIPPGSQGKITNISVINPQTSVKTFPNTGINLLVPGTIIERSGINTEPRSDININYQAGYNISPEFVEQGIYKNIFNKVNSLKKIYIHNVQTLINNDVKNLTRNYQKTLDIQLPQLNSKPIINSEKAIQDSKSTNIVKTNKEYIYDGSNPAHRIQQQVMLLSRENSLATSFEMVNLPALSHQSQQLQEHIIHTAKKQTKFQQFPDLIHPQPATTTNLPKGKTEPINDVQLQANSLPRPAGIVEPARDSNFTDLKELTNKVMEQIEQRIKTEQERRGIFV